MTATAPGICQCGCGLPTKAPARNDRMRGEVRGVPRLFRRGHRRGSLSPNWKGGRQTRPDGYITVPHNGAPTFEHIVKAELALGKPLPVGAEVHHVSGERADNCNSNLVVCQDSAYHKLLHVRTRALAECGHVGWRKCHLCGQYDEPKNLTRAGKKVYHRECDARRALEYYHRRKAQTGESK